MQKSFFVDTNILIDDPGALTILQNGEENQVYVPWTVIQELDNLKTITKKRHKAYEAIKAIESANDNVHILPNRELEIVGYGPDDYILEEISRVTIKDPILVSNDIMLRIKAKQRNIAAEPYKAMIPFKAESQRYTGFIDKDKDELVTNCFYWEEGKLHFWNGTKAKLINYDNVPWNISPKTVYQNAAMELMLNDNIDLVTVQSAAGFGKTYLALACALFKVLEEKKFKKIFVVKPAIDIGRDWGFLPGDLDSKMNPYYRSIHDLLLKLHDKRPANKVFKKKTEQDTEFDLTEIGSVNKSKLEYLPMTYIRGMDISDAIIIADECQNLSRDESKFLYTRCSSNVKLIAVGDTEQIDNPGCNQDNNGLNWTVKNFKGQQNYAHMVLKGAHSRGPICDLTLKYWK